MIDRRSVRAAAVQKNKDCHTVELYYTEEQKNRRREGRLSKIMKLGKGLRANAAIAVMSAFASNAIRMDALNSEAGQDSSFLIAGSVVAGGVALYNAWAAFKKSLELENMAKEDFEGSLKPRLFDIPKNDISGIFEELGK